jgi:hypothetical protein
MKDRDLENQIRKTEEFIELWSKLREIYEKSAKGIPSTGMTDKDFRETKELVNHKFEDLMDVLEVRQLDRHLKSGFIYDILSLDALSFMSDEKSSAMDDNWKRSYGFLNATLERLERKRRRLGSLNKFFIMSKKILQGKEIKGGKR